ncbi:efflux transporter outer membrane subunit [Yoonia algicola]|uniref:Efflux transporter outer membrane subunit n=1 Tax=Yoonia algicola TaxID=3137368 RepID=A0AAN0NI92_9RHOB
MNSRPFKAMALVALAGCAAVGPDYVAPSADVSARFVGGDAQPLATRSVSDWWTGFNDRRFDTLVARGLNQNLDIQTAFERIQTAEARLGTTGLNAQTQGGLTATTQRDGGEGLPTVTNDRATLSGTFILDLFGGVRRGREQTFAGYQAAQFDAGTVRLAYLSAVIGGYADARYFQEALELTRQTVASRQRTLNLVLSQREIGSAADLEVAQAQAQLDSAKANLPPLENGFNLSVFRIATLLAEPAGPILTELQRGAPQLFPPASAQTGIPANLLRNRPDVLAAERRYAAAVAAIGVAEAQLYPSLDISGSITDRTATTWGFGPTVTMPVFNQGFLRANRDVAVSAAREAELNWRAAVLSAVEEVQTATSTNIRARREVAALRDVVTSNERLLDLTRASYEGGSSSLLDLLDAERAAAAARLSLAAAVRDASTAWVRLQISTGNGWAIATPN